MSKNAPLLLIVCFLLTACSPRSAFQGTFACAFMNQPATVRMTETSGQIVGHLEFGTISYVVKAQANAAGDTATGELQIPLGKVPFVATVKDRDTIEVKCEKLSLIPATTLLLQRQAAK